MRTFANQIRLRFVETRHATSLQRKKNKIKYPSTTNRCNDNHFQHFINSI